jgi:hypothetical protein
VKEFVIRHEKPVVKKLVESKQHIYQVWKFPDLLAKIEGRKTQRQNF